METLRDSLTSQINYHIEHLTSQPNFDALKQSVTNGTHNYLDQFTDSLLAIDAYTIGLGAVVVFVVYMAFKGGSYTGQEGDNYSQNLDVQSLLHQLEQARLKQAEQEVAIDKLSQQLHQANIQIQALVKHQNLLPVNCLGFDKDGVALTLPQLDKQRVQLQLDEFSAAQCLSAMRFNQVVEILAVDVYPSRKRSIDIASLNDETAITSEYTAMDNILNALALLISLNHRVQQISLSCHLNSAEQDHRHPPVTASTIKLEQINTLQIGELCDALKNTTSLQKLAFTGVRFLPEQVQMLEYAADLNPVFQEMHLSMMKS
ncbi:hypothetical protein MP228_012914 [Amoeboaphelidium protococcarum]|nr:hypothetical protein MP228_012914 [Amoeboaphelidium protococcarum]